MPRAVPKPELRPSMSEISTKTPATKVAELRLGSTNFTSIASQAATSKTFRGDFVYQPTPIRSQRAAEVYEFTCACSKVFTVSVEAVKAANDEVRCPACGRQGSVQWRVN